MKSQQPPVLMIWKLQFPGQENFKILSRNLKVGKYKQLRNFCLRKKENIKEIQMETLELKNIGEIN